MAGPKAPIGSLDAHSQKASALARSASSNKLGTATSKSATKRATLKDDSESSSSDSDSDSSDSGEVNHDQMLREIAAKTKGKKTDVKPPAPAAKPKPVAVNKKESSSEESSSSSSSESDSDEESSSGSDDKKKAAEPTKGAKLDKKPAAGSDKSKAKETEKGESEDESDSSSESSSSSSESETEAKKPTSKATKTAAAKPIEASSSSSSSSESSTSDSDEEADESMAIDHRNGNNALSRVPEVVSNEFMLRKAEDGLDASDVAKFFSEAKKEGKQIWYFTAPASVPIEVVEKLEIPLERAQKGQSILSHNGDDYGVAFEDAATSRAIKLLIPSKAGDQYHMLNAPVAQTMHLKRVTQFSQDGESTLSLTQTAHTATSRPPRPQPKGLRARFQPIGVAGSSRGKIGPDASDEDVDMTEAPALPSSQKTPSKKSKSKDSDAASDKKNKRKLDTVADAAAADTPEPSKKSKKARVEPQPTPKTDLPSSQVSKVTPIVPPVIPSIRLPPSSQTGPASTPSSSKTPKAKSKTAAAEPTSSAVKKESVIPLPANFRRSSSSFSPSQPVEEPKTNGRAKKEKKTKAAKAADSSLEAPKKTTPIPLPNIPTS